MLTERSQRRSVPVRLCDLDRDVLLRAARREAAREPDIDRRLDLLWAAMNPSDDVFYVAPFDPRGVLSQ